MFIFKSLSDIKEKLRHPVVTIGNFDGVHLGHREIFRRVREQAAERGGVSVVVTFNPHPLKVVFSDKVLRLITTCREKRALIESAGIDYLLEIPFDKAFAAIPAAEFVERVLVQAVGVEHLVIGYDYAFGRGREGNVGLLKEMGERYGFSVDVLEPISNDDTVYSSTAVRKMVVEGEVEQVVNVLGRHYAVTGKVVHGHRRGHALGFPTANLQPEKDLLPAPGVYAVKVCLGDRLLDGACNIGTNPTFGNDEVSVEVFLLDFNGDLYGSRLTLFFIERVREERRFDGVEALKAAITADVERCRAILSDAEPVGAGDWGRQGCQGNK